jgi:ATP-dependent helicase/nuclease subunit A
MTMAEAAMTEPSDQPARERALDPVGSFIVQAPAGSGKTELLTQRVLRLLAVVDHPEEILAMTFTRKAAAEMRQRILGALHAARGAEPDQPHRQRTWRLGRAALARDEALGWDLLHSPSRLRVQTIDGLCATLTRQMPLLAALGASPDTVEDARPLYLAAARRALDALDETPHGNGCGDAVARLLRHLENDREKAAALIADLLARREQWLGKLLGHDSRQVLEAALADSVREQLAALHATLPTDLACTLAMLANFAYQQRLAAHKKPELLAAWAERTAPPSADLDDLPAWQGLANLCLKAEKKPALFKQLSVTQGFPSDKNNALFVQRKQEMQDCLAQLAELPELVARLHAVRTLPVPVYAGNQWQVLEALVQVLLRAAGELILVFAERGQVDFGEVHARALRALGSPEEPTDLALALDYRLRHILVDEFQDTSSGQYQLLERLTAGWQPDDGRTLFVVGDPMQSIYAFRQAEVGLYLKARAAGIGQLHLEPLRLSVNFRSQQGIVDWVNASFPLVFPEQEDTTTGAVHYSPSDACHGAGDGTAVSVHPYAARDDVAEAQAVLAIIRQARADDAEGSIAVLARGRAHLAAIAQALKQAGLSYRAVDIDRLGLLPAVQDLHSLTRALCHPADRVAWLSLLRSPLAGLTLADMLALSGDVAQSLWQRLNHPEVIAALSHDGQARLARVLPPLRAALVQDYRRRPLRDWVLGTWQALGGPATLVGGAEREAAEAYLDLLAAHDQGGSIADMDDFDAALDELFAPPDTQADERLQLMTMHKAKGLEFDTVILPGLGRPPRHEDKPLITWLERPNLAGAPQVLLAPVKPARENADPVFDYIWSLNKEKQQLETARLLYVAATRAKKRLHLCGHVSFAKNSDTPKPLANALLATLWPAVEQHFECLAPPPEAADTGPVALPRLGRLPADWQAASVASPLAVSPPPARATGEAIPFDWAGETARHVGSLVHRYLERIGREGLSQWDEARIARLAAAFRNGLVDLGVGDEDLDAATAKVTAALHRTLADPRGRWLLGDHAEARCEWALSEHRPEGVFHHVIDRSFVDEQGTRWIVDYKTGYHAGSDVDAFLDQEQARYAAQLAGYARVVGKLDARPIRLALYHPQLGGWRAWSVDD